ncbi:MAG: DNA primase [Gammaproteobacteria bacterium]|nr:DNA primase [Gammaproteobacteria bacterium]
MAGQIPQEFIQELLSRFDIIDVIDERLPLRKVGRNHQALCPFHEEKTASFTVSQEKQFYYCFGCGTNGSAISFLMEFAHMGFLDAVQELADRAGLEIPQKSGTFRRGEDHTALYELLKTVANYYMHQLREHKVSGGAIDYLKDRGVTGKPAAEFGLGYAPAGWDNLLRALGTTDEVVTNLVRTGMLIEKDGGGYYDRFRERIIFPIRDQRGRIVGFGGRVLGEGMPKYLNSPETAIFHKGRELYGLYEARQAVKDIERLFVVEGYMDVLALTQFGLRTAVATLGTAVTKEHLERLFRVTPEIVFCFDGDEAGHTAAGRALELALPQLRDGRQVSFIFLPEGEDPDSYIRKEGRTAFEDRGKAVPLSDFLFQRLARRTDLSTLDGRARLVEIAKPLISKLPTGAFQKLLEKRLAEIARIEPEFLSTIIKSGRQARQGASGPKRSGGGSTSPSLVRSAITLLLQEPTLATLVPDASELKDAGMPGIELLIELIRFAQAKPDISCGAIIERWRGTDEGRHLAKLAVLPHHLSETGIREEFLGAVKRILELCNRQRRETLLKIAPVDLTATQKQELHRLLAFSSSSEAGTSEEMDKLS